MPLPPWVDEALTEVCFYDHPAEINWAQVDQPIREAVRLINDSGWVVTGESCSGHPDASHRFVWGFNKPYLRLTTRKADMGRCLDLLSQAASSVQDEDGLTCTFGLTVYRYPDQEGFSQVGVYLDASTVWARDTAMRIFETFGRTLAQCG